MSELAINIVGRYAAGGAFGSAEKDLNKVAAAGKSASLSLAGIGASIKNVGTGLTAAVTLPLAGLGIAAVNMASDLSENMNKVDVIFGKSSESVKRWTENAATGLGISQNEALGAVDTFGALFKTMGVGLTPTTKMSENLVKLASDLASFNNLDPGEVLEKLRSGLVGEAEPLRALGIQLDAATVKQEALRLGLATSEKDISAAALAQARYSLIMQQTTTAQGDFANTSDGVANSLRIINADVKDAGASLGKVFLPYVAIGAGKVKELLASFNGLSEGTKKWIAIGGLAAAAVGPLLIGIGAALPAISMIGSALGALMGPIGLVVAGVGLLSAAWINDWGGIQEKTQAVIDYLKPGFGELLSWISSASKGDWGPLKAGLTGALQSVNATIQAFKWSDFVVKLGDWSAYVGKLTWDSLVSAFEWTTYITKLSWATVLPTLTSWGDYIKAIDWKQVITTAIDWAMWIPAIQWTEFITLLDWSVKIGEFVWSEWISKLDWSITAPTITWSEFVSALEWSAQLPALAWSDFIAHLEWTGAIDKVSWDSYVASLTWANFVTTMSDWGSYITNLDWTKIITTVIDWALWIPALEWNAFVFALDWATYIASIDWGSKVSSVNWSSYIKTMEGWGSYIVSLDWAGYVTKLASWSSYIGAFAWASFVSKLDWPSSATTFTWSTWINKLTWPDLSFNWSAWIEKLEWPEIAWDGWSKFIHALEWPVISWEGWSSFIPKFPGWPDIKSIVSSAVGSVPGAGVISGAYNYITGGSDPSKQADGTGGFAGGWSWVGERGPELMKLPRGTQIMSNYESSKFIANNAAGTTKAPPAGYQQVFDEFSGRGLTSGIKTALDAGSKKMQAAIEKGSQALESALGKVPGLFGTSEVTQKQLDYAQLGIPQNFADDYVRKLTDTVMNGKGWDGVDIKDAAMRAGIDPGLPAKVILDMVKEQWNDQSFFAGGKNTELINMDAVKADIAKQQAQASGHASLLAFLGIKSDDAINQGVQLSGLLTQGLSQGLSGAGVGKEGKGGGVGAAILNGAVADIKDSKIDVGGQLASALNGQLASSTAFAGTGSTILQAIVDSWADATKSVDMLGGIAAALKIQVDAKDSVELLKNVGGRIAILLKQGIDDFFASSSVAESVSKSVNTSTGTTNTPPVPAHNAIGTNWFAGGSTWIGETEPELITLPRGSSITPRSQVATGDNITVNVYAQVNNEIDMNSMAYKIATIIQRKR